MPHDNTTADSTVRAGSTEDILRRAGQVPEQVDFPSIDALNQRFIELEARHPDLVSSRRVGTSRLGEPLFLYTIGSGSLSHLIVGGVHPNEPVGFWTAIHLAEQLATDEPLRDGLDATWHIIPCIDPDGARLNEAWYSHPGDRSFYSRRFYRPAPDEQVEWTFPFSHKHIYFDKMLPETQALMLAIDATTPDLYVSLHNGEMGGVYYYLSRDVPEVYPLLHAIPASLDLPLDMGEPEGPHMTVYAKAVFATGQLSEAYDYLESIGIDPAQPRSGGTSSGEYASKYGTLCLVAELPYWKSEDADDASDTSESYAALLEHSGTLLADLGDRLTDFLERAEPYLTLDTPLLSGARSYAPMMRNMGETNIVRSKLAESERPATVAERFSCHDIVDAFRLRYGGMMLRALEAEVVAGIAPAPLRRIAAEAEELFTAWQQEAAAKDRTTVIPISSLIGVQYGAVLTGASYLAGAL